MEKISIIVPVYNTEKYLDKCIESILKQSYSNIELILIDDGSKDSSGRICDDYAKQDSRIKVKHKENQGQSSARNMGLDLAMGSYIAFVDSDDWIRFDMYETLLTTALEKNADLVACNIAMMSKNGEFRNYTKAVGNRDFDRVSAMKEIYKNEILTFSPCNKLYKRFLFDKIRFDEKIIMEDKDISYQLIDRCNNIAYLNLPLYYYRYNHTSTLRNNFSLKRLDDYLVQKRMYEYYCLNYPSFSDLVYLEVFDVGLVLFIQLKVEMKSTLKDYHFLIEFDRIILKRLLNRKGVRNKEKWQIRFFLTNPNLLIHYFEMKYKLINVKS